MYGLYYRVENHILFKKNKDLYITLWYRLFFIPNLISVFSLLFLCSCAPCLKCNCLTVQKCRLDSLTQGLPITMMWYNVENLFDTIDNPHKNDQEFLPSGLKEWHRYRYYQKLNHLSEVIASIPSDRLTSLSETCEVNNESDFWQMLPAVIGLCEVESKECLNDLTSKTMLNQLHYRSVITQCSDARGINIALLYDPTKVTLIKSYFLSVDSTLQTRDVLVAEIVIPNRQKELSDSLYLFLNHWPSRRGGSKASGKKRIQVANALAKEIHKVRERNTKAKILIMGDFNTYANSKELSMFSSNSLMYRVPTEPVSSIHKKIFSSLTTRSSILCNQYAIRGSYMYQGRWGSLDHFFVSSNLINNITYSTLFVRNWMIDKGKRLGGYQPRRTYLGPRYIGGYSDHLPLLLYLSF